MASAAHMKVVAICMQLAVLFIGIAAAQQNPHCIGSTGLVPVANSCICSTNCACAGKCILNSADFPDVKSCFVNCVLRNGCTCTDDGEADGVAPLPGLPATLDKVVRVTVPRPKVSRSPEEKKKVEEKLLFKIAFDPSAGGVPHFQVQLNEPEDAEGPVTYNKHSVALINSAKDEERRTGQAVHTYSIGAKLEKLGADGDKTIEVSFVPIAPKSGPAPRTIVRDVRIIYEHKNM